MKRFLAVVFAISMSSTAALAWGDCPHSKKGQRTPEVNTEEVKKSSSTQEN